MARYTGPKDRLSRREGVDLFGKGAKLTRLLVLPGVHGPKGQVRKISQYGKQLREKQKVKRMYGILERQFRKYIDQALKTKGNTVEVLFSLLESRVDNVLFRLGLATTRPQARQLVGHGHVFVNGKKLNISSYKTRIGDTITLSPKATSIASVAKLLANKEFVVPEWLARKGPAGKVVRTPKREDIKEPISEQDIIEFYSR